MIIVSQDKRIIVNFDNIVYLDIEENSFNKYVIEAYYNSKDTDFVWLGQYKTEKRAKEIIEEVVNEHEHSEGLKAKNMLSISKIIQKDFVYEMPED